MSEQDRRPPEHKEGFEKDKLPNPTGGGNELSAERKDRPAELHFSPQQASGGEHPPAGESAAPNEGMMEREQRGEERRTENSTGEGSPDSSDEEAAQSSEQVPEGSHPELMEETPLAVTGDERPAAEGERQTSEADQASPEEGGTQEIHDDAAEDVTRLAAEERNAEEPQEVVSEESHEMPGESAVKDESEGVPAGQADADRIESGSDEGRGPLGGEAAAENVTGSKDIPMLPGAPVPPAALNPGPTVAGVLGEGGSSNKSTSSEGDSGERDGEAYAPEREPEENMRAEVPGTGEEEPAVQDERQLAKETPEEEKSDEIMSESSDGVAGTEGVTQEPGVNLEKEEAAAGETAADQEGPEEEAAALVEGQPDSSLNGLEEIVSDEENGGAVEPVVREEVVDDLAHIIESIIFASDEPLPVATIKSVLDAAHTFGRVNPDMITSRVSALNAKYEADGTGFHIVEIANGYQYATRKEMAQWVSNLFKERSKRRLSNSALETVAIIAYKQPITKPEIESIRGVNVDYVLHNLLEKELVTVIGRAETVGRPLLYGTTQKFLKVFALKSLDDLPKLREIDEIIKEIRSKGAEESIQLEITALGDSMSSEPAQDSDATPEGATSDNGAN